MELFIISETLEYSLLILLLFRVYKIQPSISLFKHKVVLKVNDQILIKINWHLLPSWLCKTSENIGYKFLSNNKRSFYVADFRSSIISPLMVYCKIQFFENYFRI